MTDPPARDVWILCVRGCNEVSRDLWVGGLPEVSPEGLGMVFDRIALCCKVPLVTSPEAGWFTTLVRFEDDELTPKAADLAMGLARQVATWRREGLRVLVACSFGINRSPLVAGLAMLLAKEGTPDQVIQTLRQRRTVPPYAGETVLENPTFEAFLRRGV